MSKGIRQWLEQVGLGAYANLFVEHEIDLSVLPHITDAELDELGVALGARRRIQLRLASEREATGRGAALAAAQGEEPAPADAEHRQVTVMFCDLVGSTALSGGLDPEVYRELLGRYQDACAGEIVRYDGYVAQFLGDGVLAYFGWPRAHEDDAARAVHAGLDILEAIRALLVPGRPTEPLSVRIGIATGPVVIGDLVGASGTQPAAAVGETTNRAARVQGVAGAGAIALDEATRALLGGLFELDTLGPQVMKGIDGSPEVWRVVGERRTESRFAATRREQLTSLVGRDEELALLGRRWREAQAGEGAVVLLVGEAGIGKSRLTQALHEAVDVPHTRLLFQCSPRHTSSALHPILRQIEYVGGLDADDDPGTRIDKLDALFARSGQPPEAIVPWIAALLGIPDERHPLPALTPQRQKDRTLSALVEHIAALSTRAPVLLVVEDAHWIDPTTLELLAHLIGRIRDVPVLLIVTYRPDFRAPWVGEDHVTLLTLNRLSSRDRTRMAEQLTRETGLPSEAILQIAERSDGIPLFVEELARSALEPGPGSDSRTPSQGHHPRDVARRAGGALRPLRGRSGGGAGRRVDRPRLRPRPRGGSRVPARA